MQYSLIKHFLPSWARVCCEQYSLFMIPKLDEIHSGRKILFSCTFAFTWNIYETLILPKHEHWWKYKVLSLVEACFDLISPSSLSMKIQIIGGKITENLGFKSPLRKVKNFLSFFLFIFKFSIKNCISVFLTIFEYLVGIWTPNIQ